MSTVVETKRLWHLYREIRARYVSEEGDASAAYFFAAKMLRSVIQANRIRIRSRSRRRARKS